MKRVLVLHGHTENAHVFGRKFNDIRDALKDDVEFVFLNAPHLLTPTDPLGQPVFTTAEQYSKMTNLLDPKAPTKHTPRGWFYHTHTAEDAWAVSHSLMYLRDVLEKQGPFQGIMGYSQGGAIAALVAGLLECPNHLPHFKGIQHPPMEFFVGFSSFVVPNPAFALPKNLRTPTLLVMGSNDAIVIPELTYTLSQHFCKENLRLEVHNGGHFVPRKPEWRTFLIELFEAFAKAPQAASTSKTSSPLFALPIGNRNFSSNGFVSSTGIPFRLMPDEEAAERRRKANQKLLANRRKSWIEVVPKTFWEGGLDYYAEFANEVREEAEKVGKERKMEPVIFEEDYSVALSSQGVDSATRVHFFEEIKSPRNSLVANVRSGSVSSESSSNNSLGLELSTPSTPSCYSDDGSPELPPPPSPRRGLARFQKTVPAEILLKETDFAPKKEGGTTAERNTPAFLRRPSLQRPAAFKKKVAVQPDGKVLRVQTIGGRDIVVNSSYDGNERPYDYAIDLEKGVVDLDIEKDGEVDGA